MKRFKKFLAVMLSVMMVVCMIPAMGVSAEGTYTAWIGEQGYATLADAVKAAVSGDTITLGEGEYTLYGTNIARGKDLTFEGQGTDKTTWKIGYQPGKGGENGDYSFDGNDTVVFRNMTLQAGSQNYLGFVRIDNTLVENCVVNGLTFMWGYSTAVFKNTTFNAPAGDYAIWTYSSDIMTFDTCTFNTSGKVINVYQEGGARNLVLNMNDCTVNNSVHDKAVLNINDTYATDSFTINITGNMEINGIKPDATVEGDLYPEHTTCSALYALNDKYGKGATGDKTVLIINGTTVWANGEVLAKDPFTENEYEVVSVGEWETLGDGTKRRAVVKKCLACGDLETVWETEAVAPTMPFVPRMANFATTEGEFDEMAYYCREARAGDVVLLKVSTTELGDKYGLNYKNITVKYEVTGATQIGDNFDYNGNPLYKDGIATNFQLASGLNNIVAHVYYNGVYCGAFQSFYAYVD